LGRHRTSATTERYRGPDRRPRELAGGILAERSWVLAGSILCLLVVGLGVVSETELAVRSLEVAVGLRSASLVLAVVLAATSHLVWRATGEVRACRVGTAAWLLVGACLLEIATGTALTGGAVLLRIVACTGAAGWMLWAYLGPDIDTSVRQPTDVLVAYCATIGTWVTISVTASSLAVPETGLTAAMHLVAGTVWAIAAAVGLLRAVAAPSVYLGWLAWLGVAFAVAELARFTALLHNDGWILAASGLWTSGLLLAAIGAVSSLSRHVVARRTHLYEVALRHAEHERHRRTGERETAHELRNAVLAIEGASLTLDRYGSRIAPEDRRQLADAVTEGFSHLRALLDQEAADRPIADLSRTVAQRIALARTRGVPVELSGPHELLVAADPVVVTQVLDNLLENAKRYGEAYRSGIRVEVLRDGTHARVRVRDRGPGIPPASHEQIFERGVRLHGGEGDGVGLPLARELARSQSGDLVVLDVDGDGACLELSLRTAADGETPTSTDEVEHGIEIGQRQLGAPVGEAGDPAAAGGGTVVERDDHRNPDDARAPGRDDGDVGVDTGGGVQLDGDVRPDGQEFPQTLR
jgi:two-component system, OmpR family, sensor kinase